MGKIGIVTDSSSCIPLEIVKEYDIMVAPMAFVDEGKIYPG